MIKRVIEFVVVLAIIAGVCSYILRALPNSGMPPIVPWGIGGALVLAYLGARYSANQITAVFFAGGGLLVAFLTGMLAFSTGASTLWWLGLIGLAAWVLVPAFIEFVILKIAENHPLGAVTRVTYYEALLQPFTLIVIGLALACMFFAAYVPFYTLQEDHKMYRDVAANFVSLAALLVMVYAAAKVIDEEIENRTMLTLMSKPIARWQVVVGKYLGVVLVVFVLIAVLAVPVCLFSYLRYFDDLRVDFSVANSSAERIGLIWANHKAMLSFIPLFTLQFLMMATLAAVAVAISTRYSLALNMTAIVVLYVGANMTRFVPDVVKDMHMHWLLAMLLTHASYILPFLSNFDISQRLLYADPPFLVGREPAAVGVPYYSEIWGYVAMTAVYSLFYITAALSVATALFRTRELS